MEVDMTNYSPEDRPEPELLWLERMVHGFFGMLKAVFVTFGVQMKAAFSRRR